MTDFSFFDPNSLQEEVELFGYKASKRTVLANTLYGVSLIYPTYLSLKHKKRFMLQSAGFTVAAMATFWSAIQSKTHPKEPSYRISDPILFGMASGNLAVPLIAVNFTPLSKLIANLGIAGFSVGYWIYAQWAWFTESRVVPLLREYEVEPDIIEPL